MSVRRVWPVLFVIGVVGVFVTAAAPATKAAAAPRPVIGRPVAQPKVPRPGARFLVLFRITRSDTHGPLTSGRMSCDPSVEGKVIPHQESFRAGTARLALTVPFAAQGKTLRVKVTILSPGGSAARVATFPVAALPKPSLSVGDASVLEGNAGTTALVFPITLSAATPLPVTASYATADGTATGGSDFTAASGTVSLRPGQTTATVTVSVIGDINVESDETMTINVSAPTNAVIGDGQATGTITNDDVAARSGHYTGSTSQWQFIAFDVAEGAHSIGGLHFYANLTCWTPLSVLKGVRFEVLGDVPVNPDGTFAVEARSATPYPISYDVTVSGKLTAPSSAAGTLHVVDIVSNNPPYSGAHCWTDEVTWNAS